MCVNREELHATHTLTGLDVLSTHAEFAHNHSLTHLIATYFYFGGFSPSAIHTSCCQTNSSAPFETYKPHLAILFGPLLTKCHQLLVVCEYLLGATVAVAAAAAAAVA